MRTVRWILTVGMVVLIAAMIAGALWTRHPPATYTARQILGARCVLGACGAAALGCLAIIWSIRPQKGNVTSSSPDVPQKS